MKQERWGQKDGIKDMGSASIQLALRGLTLRVFFIAKNKENWGQKDGVREVVKDGVSKHSCFLCLGSASLCPLHVPLPTHQWLSDPSTRKSRMETEPHAPILSFLKGTLWSHRGPVNPVIPSPCPMPHLFLAQALSLAPKAQALALISQPEIRHLQEIGRGSGQLGVWEPARRVRAGGAHGSLGLATSGGSCHTHGTRCLHGMNQFIVSEVPHM